MQMPPDRLPEGKLDALGFADSPAVINGAPDLLVSIFGDAGRQVRAAVGMCALPRNALVELQMTVRVKEP
jgi:enamine deaminase RidA (YjgF/YER057c/UK114 family)